jgi:trehalose/maltose hydrolase-like predicted phosphorylase
MYPTVLYFFPKAARQLLNYRLHGLQAARDHAKATGYLGARFPWESSFTGREVTPGSCPEVSDFEIHITGDIAFAIRQYISSTRDEEWLRKVQPSYRVSGCGLIRDIAEFWVSRAVFNASSAHYEINGKLVVV